METSVFRTQFLERLLAAKQMMAETNKASVLFIIQIPNRNSYDLSLPITRESLSNVICFVEIGDESQIDFIIKNSIGIVDKIVLDIDYKRANSSAIIEKVRAQSSIPVLEYSDIKMWADSSVDFLLQNEGLNESLSVLLLGMNCLTTHILQDLLMRNVDVYMLSSDYNKGFALDDNVKVSICSSRLHQVENEKKFDVIIGSNLKEEYDCSLLEGISAHSLYDIGLQNFSQEYILSQMSKGVEVYRFDNRAAVSSVVLNLMETDELVHNVMGRTTIANIHLVSGGLMGKKGEVVVDHIRTPHSVLGIADGHGAFVHDCEYTETERANILQISKLIDRK